MDSGALDMLTVLWNAGRSAFPEVRLDRGAFDVFVLGKTADHARMASLRGADLYLACACAAGDRVALAVFEGQYLSRVPDILSRRERSPAVVDEVRQLLRTRLLVSAGDAPPRIAEYGGTGALEGWLRVVTLRVHGNLRRQERDHEDIDAVSPPEPLGADPEMLLLRERCRSAFDGALRDAFRGLEDRDRAVLRLQLRKGLTLDEIARVFQVHRATVARWIAAARAHLLAGVGALLRERLAVDVADLLGDIGSRLELSVSGLLQDSTEEARASLLA